MVLAFHFCSFSKEILDLFLFDFGVERFCYGITTPVPSLQANLVGKNE
jgi:hypothetical protein